MLRTHEFHVGEVLVGGNRPLVLIAGPCVIESEEHCQFMAKEIQAVSRRCQVPFIFKASFDKANRTALDSFRGPGLQEGLRILKSIRKELAVPILTDIHEINQIEPVAAEIDCIQIPAFLCRQTDLLIGGGQKRTGHQCEEGTVLGSLGYRAGREKAGAKRLPTNSFNRTRDFLWL